MQIKAREKHGKGASGMSSGLPGWETAALPARPCNTWKTRAGALERARKLADIHWIPAIKCRESVSRSAENNFEFRETSWGWRLLVEAIGMFILPRHTELFPVQTGEQPDTCFLEV